MKKIINPTRLALLMAFMLVVFAIYILVLYDMQVIHGATWNIYAENHRLVTRPVEATRGRILDRNETELISNRSVNHIVLDWITVQNSPVNNNDLLLDLVVLTRSAGYTHVDTLPISGSPFQFTPMNSSQAFHLNRYIQHHEAGIRTMLRNLRAAEATPEDADETPAPEALSIENVSAVELMAFMRSRYNISAEYTAEETRIIAGIRYEIDMRHIIGMDEYIFAEAVGVELISAILERNFPGVGVRESSMRRYNTTVAAHILGRVGRMTAEDLEHFDRPADAYVGRDGLERDFEEFLHGVSGRVQQTVTAGGTVVGERVIAEPQPGGHVISTLDVGLQALAEKALRDTVQQINVGRTPENRAPGGGVVVLDPNNGEVLAMASYPSFPIDRFSELFSELEENPDLPLLNRATGGAYPPASTFKMVTALAGLYYGVIGEWTEIYCGGVFLDLVDLDEDFRPRCMGRHGYIDLREAIAVSCNIYFFTIANWLGRERLERMEEFTERFGLGERTGIGQGEVPGQRSSREAMSAVGYALGGSGNVYLGDEIFISIGGGASVFSPVQLANYAAVIANGGVRYRPTLLREVRSYDNTQVLYTHRPEVVEDMRRLPGMDPRFFAAIQEGMLRTSTHGTAASALAGVPVSVASKTGTVEVEADPFFDGPYADGVFVAYAPADNPQIAIAVVIENGGSGSAVIPVARLIIEGFFRADVVERGLLLENRLLR